MHTEISRPEASKEKIHSKNQFELCYLRHKYFRKVTFNPTKEEMEPFMAIASHLSKNTFYTYQNLFRLVGFEVEDLINISRVHLTSFLGLFSMQEKQEKYKQFVDTFNKMQDRDPDAEDILDKNKANFTMFLKQRMEEMVRICRQKARNIKGLPVEEHSFYYGYNKPPKILRTLLKNYEKLGFKKLDMAIYRSIKKKVGTVYGSTFVYGDKYYVAVPLEQKSLQENDFTGAGIDYRDSIHNMNPEEILISIENNTHIDKKRRDFFNSSVEIKTNLINTFIANNDKNPEYKEELKIAKKLLKSIR